ncbi:MAG TPA: hypothetical protein ENJ28_05475 [Gammaproteobacteria bacterium]|nr:hypothetical protein [Gammaproteobacteria bacterium]
MFKVKITHTYIIALLSSFVFSANADEYLNAKEIKQLVSGNSITGIWRGKEFKQNNHADGGAIVNIKTMQLFNVPWIANEKNQYCEDWGDWGWGCYKLKRIRDNKYLSIRVDTKKEETSIWTIHLGFIAINL